MRQGELTAMVMMTPGSKLVRYLEPLIKEKIRLERAGFITPKGELTLKGRIVHYCSKEISPRRGFYRSVAYLFDRCKYWFNDSTYNSPSSFTFLRFEKELLKLINDNVIVWDRHYKNGHTSVKLNLDV